MSLTRLKMCAAALLGAGAAFLMATVRAGFTQDRPAPAPPTPPASPRTKAILAKLEKPISMVFPNQTALDAVLKYIQQATRDGPDDWTDLPIYVDPLGLREAKRSLSSTFTLNVEDAPLSVTLAEVLAQVGLDYVVKDDVLIITSPEGIEREHIATVTLPRLRTPKTKAVLAELDKPIAMPFPNETRLGDVLKYITQATTTATSLGVAIVVDAFGLQEAGKTLDSTVRIDVEGVPLQTTLRLVLEQIGLAYTIKDGLLVISSPELIAKVCAQ
jgi:hypothetical protein